MMTTTGSAAGVLLDGRGADRGGYGRLHGQPGAYGRQSDRGSRRQGRAVLLQLVRKHSSILT